MGWSLGELNGGGLDLPDNNAISLLVAPPSLCITDFIICDNSQALAKLQLPPIRIVRPRCIGGRLGQTIQQLLLVSHALDGFGAKFGLLLHLMLIANDGIKNQTAK